MYMVLPINVCELVSNCLYMTRIKKQDQFNSFILLRGPDNNKYINWNKVNISKGQAVNSHGQLHI